MPRQNAASVVLLPPANNPHNCAGCGEGESKSERAGGGEGYESALLSNFTKVCVLVDKGLLICKLSLIYHRCSYRGFTLLSFSQNEAQF